MRWLLALAVLSLAGCIEESEPQDVDSAQAPVEGQPPECVDETLFSGRVGFQAGVAATMRVPFELPDGCENVRFSLGSDARCLGQVDARLVNPDGDAHRFLTGDFVAGVNGCGTLVSLSSGTVYSTGGTAHGGPGSWELVVEGSGDMDLPVTITT